MQILEIPAQRGLFQCHAHSNTHKQPNPVVPSIFMQDKKF